MKLIAMILPPLSFRGRLEEANPESRGSGFDAAHRPGTTVLRIPRSDISIRLRQAQHLLGDETENELRADRGDARDQGFAQVTLDVKLLGVAEAAMGHDRLLAGVKTRFGCEIFRGIGRRPTRQTLVVLPGRR